MDVPTDWISIDVAYDDIPGAERFDLDFWLAMMSINVDPQIIQRFVWRSDGTVQIQVGKMDNAALFVTARTMPTRWISITDTAPLPDSFVQWCAARV